MASKEQIQSALDSLWEKYGNTLSMLTDAIDQIDQKDARIKELQHTIKDSEDIDIDLTIPDTIKQLEEKVLSGKHTDEKE